jgi:glycosyltransferase involved in cell wall biosynthesis
MRRLLFLAYHFPPQGGAGTQRAVKFARDLPGLGYAPVIITGAETTDGRWTPRDATLADELAPGTEIRRIEQAPPPSGGRRESLARWAGLPSPFAGWWAPNAAVACMRAARERPVDAILATMSPYESGAVAAAAARKLGIPWIADLRDPWALDEMRVYPSRLHRARDMKRMRRVLGTADAIVMNTAEAATRLVAAFPELGTKHVTSIPNGWDRADFAATPAQPASSAFRIVHTGALHTAMGRRGRADRLRRLLGGTQDVDVLPRSHVFLLEAVRRLRERAPELAADLEIHLAGVTTAADREAAQDPAVHLHGYLPHAESVALLRSADLLFLPMHDLPPGRRATIVPGKTYEYLAAKRPVLAAVPDGDARDLVTGVPGSIVCRPRDVRRLSDALERVLEQRRLSGRAADQEWPRSSQYERRRLSQQLVRVLDAAVGPQPDAVRAQLSLVG